MRLVLTVWKSTVATPTEAPTTVSAASRVARSSSAKAQFAARSPQKR